MLITKPRSIEQTYQLNLSHEYVKVHVEARCYFILNTSVVDPPYLLHYLYAVSYYSKVPADHVNS